MIAPAYAGPAQLALASQIKYSTVIQGATDPVFGFVFNFAPTGSDIGLYSVTGAYGNFYSNPIGTTYTGSKIADGGATFITLPFGINTANIAPGDVPVKLTLSDGTTGLPIVSQGGAFSVLAHAAPSLYIQGQVVPMTSKKVIQFATPVFSEASGGTEAAGGGFDPRMFGDPPGEPTAELDLDQVTAIGSPYITTTLAPFSDLPSDNDPSEGLDFHVNALVPAFGEYSTTFLLNYSDEQDLPGADAPGSQVASFTVDVNMTPTLAYWTVTTDSIPEPGTGLLAAAAGGLILALRRRRAA
jgi:hypothetical protein